MRIRPWNQCGFGFKPFDVAAVSSPPRQRDSASASLVFRTCGTLDVSIREVSQLLRSLPHFACRDVLVAFLQLMVKLCAPNLVVHAVSEIDRFSMNFTETICCRAKSMASMAECQLEAFVIVEVPGLNSRPLFPPAE